MGAAQVDNRNLSLYFGPRMVPFITDLGIMQVMFELDSHVSHGIYNWFLLSLST